MATEVIELLGVDYWLAKLGRIAIGTAIRITA
jgi:hypothetical protein